MREIKTWRKTDIDYGDVSNREINEGKKDVLCCEIFRSDSTSWLCSLKRASGAKLDHDLLMDKETGSCCVRDLVEFIDSIDCWIYCCICDSIVVWM